jgi:hypothetical protein
MRLVAVLFTATISITWAKAAPAQTTQPTQDQVQRILQGLLLDGPNGATIRRQNISVRQISDLNCRTEARGARCSFQFTLSTGETRRETLLLVQKNGVWERS